MNKKKINNIFKYIKLLFLVFVFILSFIYTIKLLDKVNLDVDDLFLLSILDSSNNLSGDGISSEIVDYVIKLDFLNPVSLIKNNYKGLGYVALYFILCVQLSWTMLAGESPV